METKSDGSFEKQNYKINSPEQFNIVYIRLLLIFLLIATACVCGVLSYVILSNAESNSYETQYESVSSQIVDSIKARLLRAQAASDELATIASISYRNQTEWPNAYLYGFDEIHLPMTIVANLVVVGTAPIVQPEQVESFEEYVKFTYHNDLLNPPSARERSYDFGIFSYDENGTIYHDTTGEAPHSDLNLLTPVLNVGNLTQNSGAILYNIHSEPRRAAALDNSYECALRTAKACTTMTDIIQLVTFEEFLPTSLMFRAIYPYFKPTQLVGFQIVSLSWKDILTGLVPDYICGVDAVLYTETLTYTYSICNGVAELRCSGDCHDKDFNSDIVKVTVCVTETDAHQPVLYYLELYPSETFYDIYHSNTPWIAAVSVVTIILFTSMVFLFYDILVARESKAKADILEAKRRFVRFISHEVRTPLNTLVLGLNLLHDTVMMKNIEESDKNELINLTKDLQGSSDVAVLVLNDLLHYDKIETGNLKLEITFIQPWEFLFHSIHLFRRPAKEAKIELIEELFGLDQKALTNEMSCLYLRGDKLRLAQVIGNIVSNSIKFTPPEGKVVIKSSYAKDSKFPIELRQSTKHKKKMNTTSDWMLFSVSDDGPGISPRNLKLLFGEGIQFNPNELQSGQGSGLGLWISKGIIQLHGGNIWASSDGEGCGSTFFFELPLVKLDKKGSDDKEKLLTDISTTDEEKHETENVGVDIEANNTSKSTNETNYTNLKSEELRSNKKILIVDDVALCRRMLGRSLKVKGFEYAEAEDGGHCIEILKTGEEFAYILMDNQMPVLNGPETLKELRRLGYSIPVIGVTGNVMSEDVQEFMDAGACLVMKKPFQMEVFEDFINKREES